MMGGVAIQRNPPAQQMRQRALTPVIRMRVRQKNGVNLIPACACSGEPLCQQAGTDTGIQQQAEAIHLKQTGIAGAAAREDSEAHPYMLRARVPESSYCLRLIRKKRSTATVPGPMSPR